MKVKALKCPECGANLQINENVSFCSYCGAKLYFDDGTININYKLEDIGKMMEIELDKQKELNRIRETSRIVGKKWLLNFLLCWSSVIILFLFLLFRRKNVNKCRTVLFVLYHTVCDFILRKQITRKIA